MNPTLSPAGRLLAICFVLLLISAKTEDTPELLYYWNFNDVGGDAFKAPNISAVDGSISYSNTATSELITGTGQSFAAANARSGHPAGAHLRLNNPVGASLMFNISTIGYQDLVMKYETRRSGQGAGTQKVSYSTNGIDFISFQDVAVFDDVPAIITLDFSEIPAADNNPNFIVQFEFEQGGGGSGGNNRFDDVTVEGVAYAGTVDRTTLVLPFNNASNVVLTPLLKWYDTEGVGNYDVQLSTNEDFSTPSTFDVAGASEFTLPELDAGQIYFWRVRPDGEDEWSAPRTFETVFSLPEVPQITVPADEGTNIGLRPTFEWADTDLATGYQLQVSKSVDFSLIVADISNILDLSKQININLEENATYYWRVRAKNAAGDGEWSDQRSFKTVASFKALDIRLNEIMASNKHTIADADGDFEDWIEIYNDGKEAISLNHFGVSDNAEDPFQWTFPNVTLQPGKFIIVWASDKDRSVAGQPLHANFKISADGESIFISSPDGVTLDTSPSIAMADDQSYGRFPDGHGKWGFSPKPTQGARNAGTDIPFAMTSFRFEKEYNLGNIHENIICDIYGDSLIIGVIPHQHTAFNLKPTFSAGSATSITVGGVDQQSHRTENDFTSPVFYKLASGNQTKTYEVRLVHTGLPLIYVYTDGEAPIVSKEDYVNGNIRVYPSDDVIPVYNGAMGIRGRGNSSWTMMPKKPYKIKLAAAASMLGFPSNKEWVLLANYSDKTLIRNSLAFYIGQNSNLPYTPRSTPVDVILNGIYQGSYLFGEQVDVGGNKVDLQELEENDTDESKITGGYFIEIDGRLDGLLEGRITEKIL